MSTLKTNAIQTVAGKPILNSTGSIVQVVNTIKSNRFSTSATSMTDITGLSATITPTSSSSKIFIMVFMGAAGSTQTNLDHGQLHDITRNGGACDIRGDAEGSRIRAAMKGVGWQYNSDHMPGGICISGVDSPGSTSAQTYQVRVMNQSPFSFILNGTANNTDTGAIYHARTCSTITLMEITG